MITINELKEHCERQLERLPKGSKMYEEHLVTLDIINALAERNRQIDLMSKYIDKCNYVDSEECQFQYDFKIKGCIDGCEDCIKQYFENKAKGGE